MKVLFSILAVLIIMSVSRPCYSGVLMVSEDSSFKHPELMRTTTIYLDQHKIRIEMNTPEERQVIIFRMDLDKFWVINLQDSSYMEITKKDLDKMGEQMAELTKTMDEKMKAATPEQRKYMEQFLKGRMPGQKPEVVYQKVAEDQKVNQWNCQQYAGRLQGELTEDLWTADWKKIGLNDENIQTLKEMAAYFQSFSKQVPSFFKTAADESGKGRKDLGAPVKTIIYNNGKKQNLIRLTEVSQKDFGPEMFELTGKLKKKKMPQGNYGK